MYTLLESAQPVTLSRNAARYRWQLKGSDGLPEATRKGAGVGLVFPGSIAVGAIDGNSFVFTPSEGAVVTFVFKPVPANDNEILSYQGGSYAAWLSDFVLPKLQKHRFLSPFWEASLTGTTIEIRSKLYSDGLTATIDVTNFSVATTTTLAAPADNALANHRIHYEIMFESVYESGFYEKVFEGIATPDTGGVCRADVAKILHDNLLKSTAGDAYDVNISVPTIANNMRRWYIRFQEQSGSPVTSGNWANFGVCYTILGGIPVTLENDFGFINSLSVDNSILSNMPNHREVGENEPHFLAWFNFTNEVKTVQLKVTDTTTHDPTYGSIEVQPNETALFPLKSTLLNLPANTIKFCVAVYDMVASANISPLRVYYISQDYFEFEKYLQYINAFGCPESVRVQGTLSSSVDIERATTQLTDVAYITNLKQYRSQFKMPMSYRVGYPSRWVLEAMLDGIISNSFYEVDEKGFIPLSITDKKTPAIDSEGVLFAMTINAEPTYNAENYGTAAFNTPVDADLDNDNWMSMSEKVWRRIWLRPW